MGSAQATAVDQLTTTEAAVLALLAIEGERSAYDLTRLVAKAIAHVWSPARSGLYAVLPRLEHVAQFREDTEARLAEYREIEPTNANRGHDWYHRHLLRLGIERAELELEWADRVARALRRG